MSKNINPLYYLQEISDAYIGRKAIHSMYYPSNFYDKLDNRDKFFNSDLNSSQIKRLLNRSETERIIPKYKILSDKYKKDHPIKYKLGGKKKFDSAIGDEIRFKFMAHRNRLNRFAQNKDKLDQGGLLYRFGNSNTNIGGTSINKILNNQNKKSK